jgi:cytochrome P450
MDVFAKPRPVRVIAGQLGAPAPDHQHFRHWLDLMISTDPDEFAQAPRGGRRHGLEEMVGYDSPSSSVVWRFPTEDVGVGGVGDDSLSPVVCRATSVGRNKVR